VVVFYYAFAGAQKTSIAKCIILSQGILLGRHSGIFTGGLSAEFSRLLELRALPMEDVQKQIVQVQEEIRLVQKQIVQVQEEIRLGHGTLDLAAAQLQLLGRREDRLREELILLRQQQLPGEHIFPGCRLQLEFLKLYQPTVVVEEVAALESSEGRLN
jgi:hypothetical protein